LHLIVIRLCMRSPQLGSLDIEAECNAHRGREKKKPCEKVITTKLGINNLFGTISCRCHSCESHSARRDNIIVVVGQLNNVCHAKRCPG
jgi:hypothetical protein